jgi:hypothetical protein
MLSKQLPNSKIELESEQTDAGSTPLSLKIKNPHPGSLNTEGISIVLSRTLLIKSPLGILFFLIVASGNKCNSCSKDRKLEIKETEPHTWLL